MRTTLSPVRSGPSIFVLLLLNPLDRIHPYFSKRSKRRIQPCHYARSSNSSRRRPLCPASLSSMSASPSTSELPPTPASRPSLRVRPGSSSHVCTLSLSSYTLSPSSASLSSSSAVRPSHSHLTSPLSPLPPTCLRPLSQTPSDPPHIKLDDLDSSFQLSEYLDVLLSRPDSRPSELIKLPREGESADGEEGWLVDQDLVRRALFLLLLFLLSFLWSGEDKMLT